MFGSFPWRWKSWCDGEFQIIWEALLGRSDMRLVVNMFHAYYLRENVTPIRFWIKPINVSLAAQIRFDKRICNVSSFVPTHKCKRSKIYYVDDFLRYWVERGTVNSVENNIRNILRRPVPARKPYIGISQGEFHLHLQSFICNLLRPECSPIFDSNCNWYYLQNLSANVVKKP